MSQPSTDPALDPPASPSPRQQADAAWFSLDFDYAESEASARRLVESDSGSDHAAMAVAWCVLAWCAAFRGVELDDAKRWLRLAEAAADASGADEIMPRVHAARAMVMGALGDRAGRFEALECMRRSAAALGDAYHEVLALHDLGVVFGRADLLERALDKAMTLDRPRIAVIGTLLHTVPTCLASGNTALAVQRARQAVTMVMALEAPRWQVEALRVLAETLARAGQRRDALATLARVHAHPRASVALKGLTAGRVHAALRQTQRAIAALQTAVASTQAPPRLQLEAARELAPLLARRRHWRLAYEAQRTAGDLAARLEREAGERQLLGLDLRNRIEMTEDQLRQEQSQRQALTRYARRLERLKERAVSLSQTDALTGLPNRRHADARLSEALALSEQAGRPLAVAMVDIDRFKDVNDRLGHPVGDQVLRAVARLATSALRHGDLLARYGGEEFFLLLPDADVTQAIAAAERVRLAVATHDWPAVAPGLAVTVSIGLALAQGTGDAAALVEQADRRLYDAKHAGRNRVVGPGCPGR